MLRLKTLLQYSCIIEIILIIAIAYAYFMSEKTIKTNLTTDNKIIIGTITKIKETDSYVSFIVNTPEKVQCFYYTKTHENNLKLGIKVRLTGVLELPHNNTIPNNFNYKEYLHHQNITWTMNVKKFEIISTKTNIFYQIKNNLNDYIETYKSYNYLYAFITGDKNYLDKNTYNQYQTLGVNHIFSISGMHITLLTTLISYILIKLKVRRQEIILIVFLIIYMFITDFGPSILRSVTFFFIIMLNKKIDLSLSTKQCLGITISALLFINPHLIHNIGFLYSSIISYTLVSYSHLIKGNYIVKCLKVSLLAFLISLPITVNTYYEINLLAIFNNLIFVPLISFIVYPLSLLTLLIKPLDNIFYLVMESVELISKYGLNLTVNIPKLSYMIIIIYYILIILFLNSFHPKYILVLLITLFIWKYNYYFNNNYYVYYMDVSQGDSSLIIHKNKVIMIDTGGLINSRRYVSDNIINFLKSRGLTKIEYLILTHGDYDHLGDAKNIVKKLKVSNVIFNNDKYNNLELDLINDLKSKNINCYQNIKSLKVKNNSVIFLNTINYDNENDNSNVIFLEINNYKYLFMGDASITREKDILKKYNLENIDFLKVGHHGSETSSSKDFINSIKPKTCIISVGENNRYNHPKESVIDILDNYCNILRTDKSGSIEIKLKNNSYNIKTISP